MSKDLFVEAMNFLEKLYREEEQFNSALKAIDDEFGGGYIHNKTLSFVPDLLKTLVNDQYDYISYYMWEIDFGQEYYDGCITEQDGAIVHLRNAEDLYDLIQLGNAE